MKRIFDVGLYDGADTAYYLEHGYQVTAVEANPDFIEKAGHRFERELASGQLVCVHAAVSPDGKPVELNLCGDDIGASSVFATRVAERRPIGSVTVPGVTIPHLFERYGVPEYMKVDIEGADRLCVLSLTRERRPNYVSFELGDDADELIAHLQEIGYTGFKLMNQNSFREFANQFCLRDRIKHRLIRTLGYSDPRLVKRAGRYFIAGNSSGPFPWQADGMWQSGEVTRTRLREARASNALSGWYDVHARLGGGNGA